jgi:hypothetical protein
MNRRRGTLAAALVATIAGVCSVSTPAWAEYRTFEAEGLRITFDSDWARETAPGYLPVRLEIANLADAREIEIVGTSRRYFRGRFRNGASVAVRRSIRLARGGRVALTVPVPVGSDTESMQFEVRENGRTLERLGGWNAASGFVGMAASAILLVQPQSPFADASAAWPRSHYAVMPAPMPPAAAMGSLPPKDFVLAPARAPDDWLGWTSTSAVVLSDGEWRELNDAQRTALRTWVAAGGDLVLVDSPLSALFPNEAPPDVRASGDIADYFFGRIHLWSAEAIDALGFENVISMLEGAPADARVSLPINRTYDWNRTEGRGFRLLIPGVDGVPTRAYLIILLLFSVLIGPVNYVFLKRRRLQVLFVLTAPLVALAFIALLAGYIIIGEGFGVHGRAMTFTTLDQARKQAATRATASLYAAGMTPSGGMDFPSDVAVFPMSSDGGVSRDELRIDLTDSQRFTSGLIRARTASNVETIAFRTARERLGFERQGDQVSVVNGLGQTVTRLVLREGGKFYKLDSPLAAGSRAVMKTGNMPPATLLNNDTVGMLAFSPLVASQPDGSYLAVLERSPFWEPGTAGIEERGSLHLVLGTGVGEP